jgi:asparagine synthase (glutamine-hydrolysing)
VFNGEIYNWKQLRDEHLSGQVLHSHSDTEVLFLLLRKMGADCLPLLNGMFAFAYYTPSSRQLLLARDMTGIKPLYFRADSQSFEFSSEIKNMDYVPDLHRLKEYLVFGRFGEDFIPYSNIGEVLPGSCIKLDCATGRWSQQPYRETESLVTEQAYQQLQSTRNPEDQLDDLLQRSVALHEQSDAPIGFLCSGGLDSSLISAIGAKHHPNMALYHADFEGEGGELSHARKVADHLRQPLHVTKISRTEFWEMFPEVTYAHDLPVQHPHSLSLCLIAKRAQADGLKVLLSGEGADELFAGYWFFPSYERSMSERHRGSKLRNALTKVVRRAWNRLQSDPDPYWFFNEFSPAFRSHAHIGFGDAWSLTEPIQALSLVGQDFRAWARWQQAVEAVSWLKDPRESGVLSFQLFYLRYHMQPLLHRLDRMLMIHSIEGRVPFLENELMQFALNLGVQHKIHGNSTKHLLKQVALRYLPPEIVNRQKLGFALPWDTYITRFPKMLGNGFVAEWTGLTKAQLETWCNGSSGQMYRLLSIEVWGRIFVWKTRWQDVKMDV